MVRNSLQRAGLMGICLLLSATVFSQSYSDIKGWDADVNQVLESFLNSTKIIKERKVGAADPWLNLPF